MDVAENTTVEFNNEADTADAFMSLFGDTDEDASEDKRKPSVEDNASEEDANNEDPNASEDDADTSDADNEHPDAEGDDQDADGEDEKQYVETDDVYTKVKVGDEEHEVSIKDLKRLYGQEAALTRKSQDLAVQRKETDDVRKAHVTGLSVMLQRAQERAAPYANVDWIALAKNPDISAEEASALRAEAQRAYEDVQFLQQGLEGAVQQMAAQETAECYSACNSDPLSRGIGVQN